VDGADEISRDRMFLKGGGGAMVREKVVDYRAATLVIIAELHKLVDKLPGNRPIPIEVLPAPGGSSPETLRGDGAGGLS
jgi:ribose-5-phosphate isomerase (EC 5.3.1.6)